MSSSLSERFRAARTDHGSAVLEGFHAIKHAIRFGAAIDVIVTSDRVALLALADRLAPDVVPALAASVTEVPASVYQSLSPTPHDSGVIGLAARPRYDIASVLAQPGPAPVVLLEAPAHSGNIGAVIRVAAAAGAVAVLSTGTNDPWNPGAIRGSAGLHFALPVIHWSINTIPGRPLIAIHPEGADLVGDMPSRAVLAFGSERSGLSPALLQHADARVRIPMEAGVASLNLATAVAIMLYQWKLR